jgi:hypothetical protein
VEITGITGDENVGVNLLRVLKLVKGDLLMKERKKGHKRYRESIIAVTLGMFVCSVMTRND